MAQLAQWLFPTPKICVSNPVLRKMFHHQMYENCGKRENKEKETGNGFRKNGAILKKYFFTKNNNDDETVQVTPDAFFTLTISDL